MRRNGGARRHPSSDIATQCSLRSGDTAEPRGKNDLKGTAKWQRNR